MDYKLIGAPCGEHGPYKFYKALKYNKNGKTNILALSEFFFVKLWTDSDLISIGELQLLWEDKNSEQTLASLRLYILPENTPDGRTDIHGEDEVLAITEKVVIRVEDLLTWITHATDWHWGLGAIWGKGAPASLTPPYTFTIDMDDVNKEKEALESNHWETQTGVVVLSYPRYCRYRGVMKRLQGVEEDWLRTSMVVALGGFTAPWKNTRILFCKETFDYPELEGHELLCNHLAPKLKGRPRKRKRATQSPTESETESESSQSTASSSTSKVKPLPKPTTVKPRLRCTLEVTKRPTRGPSIDERNFMNALHIFMKDRKTPISRIPVVGFKEVNLYKFFKKVTDLGGYDVVTAGKLWKYVYEVMGGDMTSTSAATLSRRHYEKLLLPYEKHVNGVKTPQPKLKQCLPPITSPQAKGSSLRNIRLKQEKTTGGKENIPQEKESEGKLSNEPEIIDLVSDEPPVKSEDRGKRLPISVTATPRALSPLLKKQKLEILKEGGLEVTPVTPVTTNSRASVIKQAALPPPRPASLMFRESKVSITVTPDLPHLMSPPGPSSGSSSSSGSSKRTVYGNPKEVFVAPPAPSGEVLDLRTKPRINIGSNLEITLVPPKIQPKPPIPSQARTLPPIAPKPLGYQYPYKHSYMPVVDHRQVYLSASAIYNNMYPRPYPPQQLPHMVYRELLRRQVFPSLDGTTSITLVGQTPTSK